MIYRGRKSAGGEAARRGQEEEGKPIISGDNMHIWV